jgi:hypothetical protein
MGYDADFAAHRLQTVQCVHGDAQGVGIKTAESFVDEEGLHRTRFEDSDANPRAKPNETRKDSAPPERECTERISSPMS